MNWLGAHVVFDRDSLLPTLVKAAAILVVVGILAGSCAFLSRGSLNGQTTTIYLRNESPRNVSIRLYWDSEQSCLAQPAVSCSGGQYGPNEVGILVVPAWQVGQCATAQWPDKTPLGVALFDSETVTTGPETLFPSGSPFYVRIDSGGSIHVGEPVPADASSCQSYELVNHY